jgi:DNA-binding NtrC family response regulator
MISDLLAGGDPKAKATLWLDSQMDASTWPRDYDACKALASAADALRLQGWYPDCLKAGRWALEIAYELKAEDLISMIQVLLGSVDLHQGNVRHAREAFTDALVAARRSGHNLAQCRALLWLAYVEQLHGQLAQALHLADECLEIALRHGGHQFQLASHRLIALFCTQRGEFARAKSEIRKALSFATSSNQPLERARCAQLEAWSASQWTGSAPVAAIAEARQTFYDVGSIKDVCVAFEYEAAVALNARELDLAEAAVSEAVRISLQEFPDGDMTSQSYRLWAEIDVCRGDFVKAREHANDALGVARRVGERIEIGALERIFGQCEDAAGREETARAHFAESIRMLSDCGARYELAHSHLAAGTSEAFDRAGRLMHLHSALALFQEMQVERLTLEAEEAIRRLTSPPRVNAQSSDVNITVITRNPAMKQVVAELDRFKDTPHTILLEGETGAGKDLLAAYAHFTSQRADRPFVEFNAAAVPEALVESELFGHVKGSFTGALRDREGLLFAAKSGTFFFNEIGEAPLTFQAKLLTVIESRKARPVGANAERPIEARLIFATNRNLQTEVSKGRFRKDLYFRLSTAHLRVPPVRDRLEDIGPLLAAFLLREGLSMAQVEALQLTPEWASLGSWPWEGNVRELSTFAQRLTVEVLSDTRQRPELVLPRLMKRTVQTTSESREAFDRCRIESALRKHGGNKRRAAGDLGIPESTLRWKINHLGIALP